MSLIFESNGQLNDWTAANGIEIVDAGQPLLSYDPDISGKGVRLPPIRAVTDFISRHISTLPFKVYQRAADGDRQRDRDSPLAQLIDNPTGNPAVPANRFWAQLLEDGLLADRFLAIHIIDTNGAARLKRIPPRRWSIIADIYDEPTGVKITDGDGMPHEYSIQDDDLLIDIGYAYAGAKGDPQIRRLDEILAEYQASIEYRAAINQHGLQAPFVIERDKPWPDKASHDRFARGVKEFTRGGGSAGGGLLLEDGMKANKLDGFKPIDVNDLDARDKIKIDIANAYGIPAEILGIRQGNFSNLSAFKQMLYAISLKPYIVAFEQSLNACLRDRLQTYDKGRYIEIDLDGQLRGDPEAQYGAFSTATGRPFMTTGEARERLNLNKLPNTNELVTPLNVLVGGQTSPQDGTTTSRGKPPQEEAPDDNQDDQNASESADQ